MGTDEETEKLTERGRQGRRKGSLGFALSFSPSLPLCPTSHRMLAAPPSHR